MFNFDFRPRGVCSRMIHIGLSDDGNTIEQVSFEGGCNGNLKAISKLVAGHSVDEISGILAGNTCGPRRPPAQTSSPAASPRPEKPPQA